MELAFEFFLFYPVHCEFPSNPCHLKVHPPFCIPMLSKLLNSSFLAKLLMFMILSPTKTMYSKADVLTGRTPAFFNKTADSWTAVNESSYSVVKWGGL